MTNPDNVGGQYDRELIALMLEVYASTHEAPMWPLHREGSIREQVRLLRDADNAEAARVRTLCRAAPAGGDVVERVARAIYEEWRNDPAFVGWVDGGNSDKQYEARSLARLALYPPDSAPAGSGEVEEIAKELLRLAKVTREVPGPHAEARGVYSTINTLETAAALLRKLSPAGSGEVDIAGAPKHWGDVMRELEAAAPDDLKDLVFEVSYACDQRLSFLALRVRELEALLRKLQQGAGSNGDGNV